MERKTINRLTGGLEALAGTILIFKSEEYGFGNIGRYLGGWFVAEGTADVLTGKLFYLTDSIINYFKKNGAKN